MLKDEATVVYKFRDILLSTLREMLVAYPAIKPQTEEDKIKFKRGMVGIQNMIVSLEKAETVRELGRIINIQNLVEDFDVNSINEFSSNITASARLNMRKMTDTLEGMYRDE